MTDIPRNCLGTNRRWWCQCKSIRHFRRQSGALCSWGDVVVALCISTTRTHRSRSPRRHLPAWVAREWFTYTGNMFDILGVVQALRFQSCLTSKTGKTERQMNGIYLLEYNRFLAMTCLILTLARIVAIHKPWMALRKLKFLIVLGVNKNPEIRCFQKDFSSIYKILIFYTNPQNLNIVTRPPAHTSLLRFLRYFSWSPILQR